VLPLVIYVAYASVTDDDDRPQQIPGAAHANHTETKPIIRIIRKYQFL